jgi:glutathione S-transferase
MLKLYSDRFWISPWVFSGFVTLKEKGLPFEVADVALDKKETRRPDYAQATLTAKVPALEHDGFWLSESAAIVEYLEDTFPERRVLPADPQERARARQVMSFLRTDFYALREERSTATMFYDHARDPLGEQARADADRLLGFARTLVKGTSLFGAWSIADSELAFCLQRLGLNGHDLGDLRQFVAAQWERPSVQEFVRHPRAPYVPY